jgi:phosphoribosyl 1,2-cyclic phosphodiesterase
MPVRFRTCCASSSGNCLHLEAEGAGLLIDCGFSTQRAFIAVLDSHRVDAVLISHAHTDHVNYHSLRVLARRGIPLYAERRVMAQLLAWPSSRQWAADLRYFPFTCGERVSIAGCSVEAIPVAHAPGFPNFAFRISAGGCRVLTCTDSHDAAPLLCEIASADFIYLESNHDLELLRLFPNHASRYHLSNIKAGRALSHCLQQLFHRPRGIMLGHLSTQRNRPDLALATVREEIARAGATLDVPLSAAPAFEPSPWVEL